MRWIRVSNTALSISVILSFMKWHTPLDCEIAPHHATKERIAPSLWRNNNRLWLRVQMIYYLSGIVSRTFINKPVRLWYDWRYVGTFIITSTKETLHRPHKIVYEMDNVVTLLQYQWFHESLKKKNFGNSVFYLMLSISLFVLFWFFFVICDSSVAFCSFFLLFFQSLSSRCQSMHEINK